MTTHPLTPPTLAQVLRAFTPDQLRAMALLNDLDDERRREELCGKPSQTRGGWLRDLAAALEAPARDAGREVVCYKCHQPMPRASACFVGDLYFHMECPATTTEPPPVVRGAGREGHEFEPGLNPKRCAHCGGLAESTKHTEPPPPAWDAEAFIDKHHERRGLYHLERPRLMHLVRDAYTAGQRDAGVQVPEKMPEWLPELLNKFMWCNSSFADFGIDEPGFYAALRTHLTQTREG
jgi:hypothetical protein